MLYNNLSVILQGAPAGGGGLGGMIFLPIMLLVFYFFMIRPQQKKAKEQNNFLGNLKKGDKVVTIGGIHGTITQIDDNNSMLVQIDQNTKIRIDKSAVSLDFTKAANYINA